MLTPEYLEAAPESIVELYSKLDEIIIRDIVRRMVKTGGVTLSAAWQAERLQEAGLLYDDIVRKVSRMTNTSEAQVRALFQNAGVEALKCDFAIYKAAGLTPLPLQQSPAAATVLQAGIQKTQGYLKNLSLTTATATQQAYINAVTLAEMQVESGAFDYVTAIRNAVRDAAQSGTSVLYPTGHTDKLDVAVRRAVLTGVSQTAAQISLRYADDMDCDLVETTAHVGARPSHQVWQGKVFSRSGSGKYPDFVASTGYGTGDGLCGWNCRHSFFPFFEGLSESAYPRGTIYDYNNRMVTYNGKQISYYDASQIQRAYERRIRATKRELAGYDEGIKATDSDELRNALKEKFDSSSAKLKRQESELKDFLQKTGLDRQREREQVLGFGKSQAQKATWAKKKVDIQQRNDILKEEIRTAGNLPKAAKINLSPTVADTESLSFDEQHINQERGHNVTREQAIQWLREAKISVSVWNGRYLRYYGINGTVYVDTLKSIIRTAYSSEQYGNDVKAILEVILKNGL